MKFNVFDKPDGQRECTHSVVARKGGMKFNDENGGKGGGKKFMETN